MPFLSLCNPRSRASLVTALLLLEFMAILWLRESSPNDSSGRASLFNPRSQPPPPQRQQGHDPHEQEEVLRLQTKKHHVSTTKQEDTRFAQPVVARSGSDVGRQAQEDMKTKQDTSDNTSHKDQGSRGQRELKDRHPRQRVAETTLTASTTVNNQSTSKRTTERIKSRVSSLAAAAAASIPKARRVIKGNNKNAKNNNNRKPASKGKHPNELKNQRGGFKSTRDRKQAQLIPVLDEHGATIEDHFISPRDSNGDGVPDYFVLLRPSADNGNDMLDLGLFDDDIVVPSPAPVPVVVVLPPPPPLAAQPVVVPGTVPPPVVPEETSAAAPVLPTVKVEAAATTIPPAPAPIVDAAVNAPVSESTLSSPSPPTMAAPIDS